MKASQARNSMQELGGRRDHRAVLLSGLLFMVGPAWFLIQPNARSGCNIKGKARIVLYENMEGSILSMATEAGLGDLSVLLGRKGNTWGEKVNQ